MTPETAGTTPGRDLLAPLPPNGAGEAAQGNAGRDGATRGSIPVALAPDGLTIVLTDGRTRHLPCGAESGRTTAELSIVIGPAEMSEEPVLPTSGGCLAERIQRVLFGWYPGGGVDASELTTMEGVTVGSTALALTAACDACRMDNSMLGAEYSARDLAVILSREGPDARRTDLHCASTSSVARNPTRRQTIPIAIASPPDQPAPSPRSGRTSNSIHR